MQVIDNNFLVPFIVGSKVRINALVSIVGVLVGGALAELVGNVSFDSGNSNDESDFRPGSRDWNRGEFYWETRRPSRPSTQSVPLCKSEKAVNGAAHNEEKENQP